MEGVFIMNKRWDIDKIRMFVNENSKCKMLSTEYGGYSSKLLFKCECGNEFEKQFNKFKSGNQRTCPKCSRKRTAEIQSKSHHTFIKQVELLVGNEYSFLEEYKSATTKIKVKHNSCGYEYHVTPDSFMSKKRRCPRCNGGIKKNEQTFLKEVYEIYNGEYEVIGEYVGARKEVKIKHIACGYEFEVQASNFLRKLSACHKCNSSFGEQEIISFLELNKVEYKTEYTFAGLRGKRNRPFPFDFVVFENNKPKVVIEYDGIQHFEPVKYFGGIKGFMQTQERDRRKNEFCLENNIKLIRIPYWKHDSIEEILKDAI